jgi:hypothetical protein
MNADLRSFVAVLAVCFLCAPLTRAQEDPLNDPDFQAALKQSQELQKKNPPVKMSDLQKQADEIQAEQKKEEQKEKAALQKQLDAPGPLALPDWTPATPEFKATGSPARKIVDDDHIAITQTGTSSRTPKELADAWEAAIADKKINHVRNNISSNNNLTTILFLSTRTDPREEVRMEARRPEGAKITQVTISSPLPKPEDDDSDND